MTFYKACKISIFYFATLPLFFNNAFAFDLSILQQQCVDIGFQIKTVENGKCVLALVNKLRSTSNSTASLTSQQVNENDIEAAKKRNYERQKTYEKDAEIIQKKREIEALQQQVQQQNQQELLRQQKQNSSLTSSDLLFMLGVLGGAAASAYTPPVPTYQPINCTSHLNGTTVNTSCW